MVASIFDLVFGRSLYLPNSSKRNDALLMRIAPLAKQIWVLSSKQSLMFLPRRCRATLHLIHCETSQPQGLVYAK